jgi:hypothetical protein
MIFDILYYDENQTNHIMKIESKDIDQCVKDLIKIQDLKNIDDIDYNMENEAILTFYENELYQDEFITFGYIIRKSEDQKDNKFDTIYGSAFYEGTTKKENSLDNDIKILNACQKLGNLLK